MPNDSASRRRMRLRGMRQRADALHRSPATCLGPNPRRPVREYLELSLGWLHRPLHNPPYRPHRCRHNHRRSIPPTRFLDRPAQLPPTRLVQPVRTEENPLDSFLAKEGYLPPDLGFGSATSCLGTPFWRFGLVSGRPGRFVDARIAFLRHICRRRAYKRDRTPRHFQLERLRSLGNLQYRRGSAPRIARKERVRT